MGKRMWWCRRTGIRWCRTRASTTVLWRRSLRILGNPDAGSYCAFRCVSGHRQTAAPAPQYVAKRPCGPKERLQWRPCPCDRHLLLCTVSCIYNKFNVFSFPLPPHKKNCPARVGFLKIGAVSAMFPLLAKNKFISVFFTFGWNLVKDTVT
jgi:hypothetical protein